MATKIPMEEIIDTNILVRLLVGDNKKQQKQAVSYFREAELGDRNLWIKTVVVAEVCYVLESVYKKSHEQIADGMERILSAEWLKIEDKNVIQCAWAEYRQGNHFIDSFLIAWSRVNEGNILTFDKDLKKKVHETIIK